ncbi:hypothetical protein [Nocardia camponoti]|uniref:Uncharacterized protein n=1 Tax=Nocardia camponoti TaxID=1616106 RepID=A0A917QSB4_9NOCA|nr:hypothetical protein [Nocardia camponoti]GGK65792.1 hypothetical protein GCM10011591_42500 [Nocardia camponoti]
MPDEPGSPDPSSEQLPTTGDPGFGSDNARESAAAASELDAAHEDASTASDESADESSWRPSRGVLIGGAFLLIAAVASMILGITNPRPSLGITTDRLGPAPGQQIEQYFDQARDSLHGTDSDPHWALVSFTEYLTAQQLPQAVDGLRISGVIWHVPIDRVQTPVLTVATPAGDTPAVNSADAAAGLLAAQQFRDQRSADIAKVTESRLRAGCACAAGIVVRGTLTQLNELAAKPDVRAVQALPADAVAGRFAVSPLRPDQVGIATTTVPDDGPVPTE